MIMLLRCGLAFFMSCVLLRERRGASVANIRPVNQRLTRTQLNSSKPQAERL